VGKRSRNDEERELWVRNDEGLYRWWRSEMGGERKLRQFIRENRTAIDEAIDRVLNKEPEERSSYYMIGRGAVDPGTTPRE